MSARNRTLPSWMANKEIKVKEKKAPLKTQKKRRTSRATFYCMNEAELVEAAALSLTNGSCEDVTSLIHQQVEKQAKDTLTTKSKPGTSQIKAKPLTCILDDLSSDCVDLETTYVSETDLDITEVEPLPNTKNPQHPESEGERSRPAQDDHKLMNIDMEAEKEKQITENTVEEDEALQLVRQIFFT